MSRIVKILSSFSISLALSVFFAHMLIPHDHHLSEYGACAEESCPASKNNSHQSSRFPAHCHVFNDLTSEKAITCTILKKIQSITFESLFVSNASETLYRPSVSCVFSQVVKLVNTSMPGLISLRAPPVSV
jgi:hypothetical protein